MGAPQIAVQVLGVMLGSAWAAIAVLGELVEIQWKAMPVPGVTLDGVWIAMEVLGELEDRPQNTEITGQEPLLLDRHVKRILVAHGLAAEQTRGGVRAGPELAAFMRALTWTPAPAQEEEGQAE